MTRSLLLLAALGLGGCNAVLGIHPPADQIRSADAGYHYGTAGSGGSGGTGGKSGTTDDAGDTSDGGAANDAGN